MSATPPAPSGRDELAEAVGAAAADRARRHHLDAQLEVAERLVAERIGEGDRLRRQRDIEEADVRRLEGLSPTRLWATLRGDAVERLAVDKAEADAAARAVVAAEARLAHARADAERVRAERAALGDVEGAYRRALDDYEAALQAQGAPAAAELGQLLEQLGTAAAESREIDEAARALEDARAALRTARGRLDSAGGWSTYDTFFGGGLFTDLMKHSRIDEATTAFVAVNRALERLSTELADIAAPGVRGVQISESLAVFDVLFDNVLADWVVRERIAQAKTHADELEIRLEGLSRYLADRASQAARAIAELSAKRERILTTT